MLVVISSEAPKKRKIYHKMGCIYAERIKFQNLLEIKVEQAEKEGYCECKYCAGLRGDVRTRKAQMLSWTHKKEMEFKFIPSVSSYPMFVDKGKLDKIVYNLLSNAFKYTPEGGKIVCSVDVEEETKKLIISVSDTGIGIPLEKRGQLFSRFMQR